MELIRIEKSKGGKDVVDARHLHEKLEVATRFNDWFSLMLSYGFKENVDYCRYLKVSNGEQQSVINPNPKQDYYLTEDMCMHLAMIQRTDKGMEVRQWFIDRERARKAPRTHLQVIQSEMASFCSKMSERMPYF